MTYSRHEHMIWWKDTDGCWVPDITTLTSYVTVSSVQGYSMFGNLRIGLLMPEGFNILPEMIQCREMAVCVPRYYVDNPAKAQVIAYMDVIFREANPLYPARGGVQLAVALDYTVRFSPGRLSRLGYR